MKISERTMTLLNNFATISPSITLQPGKKLRTLSDSGTVIAVADIEEDFPENFAILDLGKLLSVMKLKQLKNCELTFDKNKLTLVGGEVTQSFWASRDELLTVPQDDIPLSGVTFQAEIKAETLSEFTRACSALGHKTALLKNLNGRALLVGTTHDLDNSNDYQVDLGETELSDSISMVDTANLKMVDGNYIVKASADDEIIVIESKDGQLRYIVGMMVA